VETHPAATQPRLVVSPPGVIVTSLRPSRDKKALLVRLYRAGQEAERATVRWAAPAPKAVWKTDLSGLPLEPAGDTIDIPAWGVVTVRADLPE
jgi:alpha-mannosidase